MRGAGIRAIGGIVEVLDLPEPRPLAGGEALIEVRAAGAGNWDEFVRTGDWDVGIRPPMALGVEAAGEIVAAGDEVTAFGPGDEVMTHVFPLRDQGTWAERLIAPAALLAGKPENVAWEVAAAFPVPALTAEQVLSEALKVEGGTTLLVNGASGVTGNLLVELAALKGARVIATAGSRSADRVRGLGADEVVDYRDPGWPDEVRRLTAGRGVSAAANAARGGASAAIRAVADSGRLATITSDPPQKERGITVSTVFVHPDGGQLARLAALLGEERLSVPIGMRYSLANADVGLAAAVGGAGGGAVVITP